MIMAAMPPEPPVNNNNVQPPREQKFYITESFLAHHTNTDPPEWVRDLIKEKKLVWHKDGTVTFKGFDGITKTLSDGSALCLFLGVVSYIDKDAPKLPSNYEFMQQMRGY